MNRLDSAPAVSARLEELALLIQRHAPYEGTHETAVPELRLMHSSHESEPIHSVYSPSLCVVAQGSKTAALAGEVYRYDPATYMITSVHLPIIGKVVQASPQLPYLSLQLAFSADAALDIVKETGQPRIGETGRGIAVNPSTLELLDAILRLIRLLDAPKDIPVLAPLIIREILYRVLLGEQGALLRQFAVIGSHANCISKAILLIKRDYDKPLVIEELAKEVNMSPSSLHKHFKKVTAMSPLQYQKVVRLQEARRLLLAEPLEAADAGFRVGYESPSQFSREYARMFGRPPKSDIKHLRDSIAESEVNQ